MATVTHTETEEPATQKRWYDTGKYNEILLVALLVVVAAISYFVDRQQVKEAIITSTTDALNATADAIVSTTDKITATLEEHGE